MLVTESSVANPGRARHAFNAYHNGNGTGTLTLHPTAFDRGNHSIRLTATDNGDGQGPLAALTGEYVFVVTVTAPNVPPVLDPIGMTESTFDQPPPPSRMVNVAVPYRSSGRPVRGGPHVYPERAPAGLWTTPSDLAHAAIEVQNEYAGKSTKILSQEMMRQMLTRQKDDWGLGFDLGNSGQTLRFGHGGSAHCGTCDGGCGCEGGCYPGDRFYARAEYLLWSLRGGSTPPAGGGKTRIERQRRNRRLACLSQAGVRPI